jgi:predicted O-methyltransferase YrrM
MHIGRQDMNELNNFANIARFDADVEKRVDDRLKCQMSGPERLYLNGLIRMAAPKNILEFGVYAGGSSAIILNAIRDRPDARLTSFDYNTLWCGDFGKKTGFNVFDDFPELAKDWKLHTGGMCGKLLDHAADGKKFDFALIDTVHSNPGEFVNMLEILPYLDKDAIVVLHDVSLHTLDDGYIPGRAGQWTNCVLLNMLGGRRIPTGFNDGDFSTILPNIGAVLLDCDRAALTDRLFECLTLPWAYAMSEKDIDDTAAHFGKHYSPRLVGIFRKCAEFYTKNAAAGKCWRIFGLPVISIKNDFGRFKSRVFLFGFIPICKKKYVGTANRTRHYLFGVVRIASGTKDRLRILGLPVNGMARRERSSRA